MQSVVLYTEVRRRVLGKNSKLFDASMILCPFR